MKSSRRRSRQSGQAVVEYAFLMVLLATIGIAVIMLAGAQLTALYQDVSYEFTHFADATTVAPDGTMVSPGVTPVATCESGSTVRLVGHKWKCKKD